MKLLNLTPHEVVLCGMRIASSGQQARVATTRKLGTYTVVTDRPVPEHRSGGTFTLQQIYSGTSAAM